MLKLAWRSLVHEQTRLAISTGGVGLAVLLMLVMAGIFAVPKSKPSATFAASLSPCG